MQSELIVKLSPRFCRRLENYLSQNQAAVEALVGVYEGRQLEGDYELEIVEARLRPKRNGANPEAMP